MSDNWEFDPSDVGEDNDNDDTDTSSSGSTGAGNTVGTGLFMLPLTIVGIYAFVAKATVLSALESIVGSGGLALAITNAFWIIGLLSVAFIAIAAILTVLNLLAAVVKQSFGNMAIGLIGIVYFAIGSAGATFLFGDVPFLVGFMLTTNLVIGGIIMLIFAFAGLAATVVAS